jgi:hypothetical protein
MGILKKTLHLIFSSFLVWQTYLLAEKLIFNHPDSIANKLLDAVFLNVFVTGIFTLVYSFPIHKALPKKYYTIQNPALLKRIGQIIQIDLFKKLLTHTIWRKQQNKNTSSTDTEVDLRIWKPQPERVSLAILQASVLLRC